VVVAILFLAIYGYSKYREIQRFSPPSPYVYEISEEIDINYHNESQVSDYYHQVNDLEQFVRASWSGHKIDVLFPRENKGLDQTLAEVYTEKRAKLQLTEARLEHSAKLKALGFSNDQIRSMELTGLSPEAFRAQEAMTGFTGLLKVGDSGQLVFLIQKYLDRLGYEIMLDGIYKEYTEAAIKDFQEKQGLLPTGSVDRQTLQKLYSASQTN